MARVEFPNETRKTEAEIANLTHKYFNLPIEQRGVTLNIILEI